MDLSIKENICEYCGQALMPGKECNCPDAERERAKQQQAIGEDYDNTTFGALSDDKKTT